MNATTRLILTPLRWTKMSNGHYEAPVREGRGRYIVRPFQGSRWEAVAVNAFGHEFDIAEADSADDAQYEATLNAYENDLRDAVLRTGDVCGWTIDSDARMGNLYVVNPANEDDCIYACPFWTDQDTGEKEQTLTAQRHVSGKNDDYFSPPIDTGVRWTGNLTADVIAWREAIAKLIANPPAVTK